MKINSANKNREFKVIKIEVRAKITRKIPEKFSKDVEKLERELISRQLIEAEQK